MYWQVYLHKNVICSGEMLVQIMNRARDLLQKGTTLEVSKPLHYFLSQRLDEKALEERTTEILENFYRLDDTDIMAAVKSFASHKDTVLSFLSKALLERQLLHIDLRDAPAERPLIEQTKQALKAAFPTWSENELSYLLLEGKEANNAYKKGKEEILILLKNNSVRPISEWQEHCIQSKEIVKYFACYPKQIKH